MGQAVMAADWQEIGRRVRDKIINESQNFNAKRRAEELIGERPEYAFYRVLLQYSVGNSSPLKEYLRSDRPLLRSDRELLALELAGELSPPPKRGRPRDENARAAADFARRFYRQWKSENICEGIKDWGLGDEMKDQSCRYAIEIFKTLRPGEQQPDLEVVPEMMERPISRRK